MSGRWPIFAPALGVALAGLGCLPVYVLGGGDDGAGGEGTTASTGTTATTGTTGATGGCALICALGDHACEVAADAPLVRWSFDGLTESETPADFDVLSVTDPTWSAPVRDARKVRGVVGTGLGLARERGQPNEGLDTYMRLPRQTDPVGLLSLLASNRPFSIELWFRPAAHTALPDDDSCPSLDFDNHPYVFQSTNGDRFGVELFVWPPTPGFYCNGSTPVPAPEDGNISFDRRNMPAEVFPYDSYVHAIEGPAVGVWSHLVMTYDGNEMLVLMNGSEPLSSRGNGSEVLHDDEVDGYVGGFPGHGGLTRGDIDEVAFYDYALAPGRARCHYEQGIAATGEP